MDKNEALENPFEAEALAEKPPRPKRKKVVFVVAEPSEKNKSPRILKLLDADEGVILLHNRFDYENEAGQNTLQILKNKEPPKANHLWEQMMRQEFWGLKQADVVIFDLDSVDTFHLMSVAAFLGKPIVCVSDTLKPVPAYFSGSVLGVFKADQLDLIWKITKKTRKKVVTPVTVGTVGTVGTEGTKEKIQEVLMNHFKKTNAAAPAQ